MILQWKKTSALFIAFLVGLLLLPASAFAASSPNGPSLSTHTSIPNLNYLSHPLIVQANPYVTVSHFKAKLSPKFSAVASATTVQQVRTALSRYNALPTSVKENNGKVFTINLPVSKSAAVGPTAVRGVVPTIWLDGCNASGSVGYYWWGDTFWMNDCASRWISGNFFGMSAIAAAVAYLVPAAAPIAVPIGVILAGVGGGLWVWTSGCEWAGYSGVGATIVYGGPDYPTC